MDLPTTREAALACGSRRYFSGVPCRRGHISPRYSHGACIECIKLRNSDPEIRKRRVHREDNLETILEKARQKYHNNKREFAEKHRKYRGTVRGRAKGDYPHEQLVILARAILAMS